jgi:hypothetical protein
MCNKVCHTVRENALTVNCSLIFKPKRQCIVHLFFPLTIKDKTNISLTFKILHLRLGSFTRKVRSIFTRKVRSIFTLKIIVSIFSELHRRPSDRDRMVDRFTTNYMQAVPITTEVVSSNPAHGEIYSMQHHVIACK